MRSILIWSAVLVAACAAEPVRGHRGKPEAPVKLEMTSVALGQRRFEVHMTATPTADVDDVKLRLVLPDGVRGEEPGPRGFGKTAAGTARAFTWHVQLSVPGADIVGDARVVSGVSTRNRAQVVHLGAASPIEASAPATTIVLPNGERVEEVRP